MLSQYDPTARQKPIHRSGQTNVAVLNLFVLTAFAVAQPVYDRVGERPAYLADMGVKTPAIILLGAVFSLILPAGLAACVWGLGRLRPNLLAPLHAVLVFLLLTLAVAPATYQIVFLPGWMAIGLALATGAAAACAYYRFGTCRRIVTAAAPAIVTFPTLFLLASPVAREFLLPGQKIETKRWRPIPVVLVVLDECNGLSLVNERGEIDSERFPHFAELARQSLWFRNCTSVHPYTAQAAPALLSGRYPSTSWDPTTADRPQNLFSVLDATGAFDSAVFEPISRLAVPPRSSVLRDESSTFEQFAAILPAIGRVLLFHITPPDLRSQLPQVPRLWFGFYESQVVDPQQRRGVFRYAVGDDRQAQFDHFLNCLTDSSRPQLGFCHVLLPHFPWTYLPTGRQSVNERFTMLFTDDLNGDELYIAQCQQRYLLQLTFTDSQIGRLLERLRQTRLYDKCLLIVTADHGVAFNAGATRREANGRSRPDVMSVPLFIKLPGQTSGRISDKNVETVDILPTIADFLGIELQLPVDGRSILDSAGDRRSTKTWYNDETAGRPPVHVPADILRTSTTPADIRRRFGPGEDRDALFRIGPHPELAGRRVSEFSPGTDRPVEVLTTPRQTDYRPDGAAVVPCLFQGRVLAADVSHDAIELAVSVNGVIRATTRTYRVDYYRDRFLVLVPESALQEGPNQIQFHTITGPPDDVHLTPCVVGEANP